MQQLFLGVYVQFKCYYALIVWVCVSPRFCFYVAHCTEELTKPNDIFLNIIVNASSSGLFFSILFFMSNILIKALIKQNMGYEARLDFF